MARTPIIVAGMHRSGTSLVASMLSGLGVALGPRLRVADRNNRQGYFEDIEIVALNREMLAAAVASEEPGYPDWGWTEGERLDCSCFGAFRARASHLIQSRINATPPKTVWGWKDPRTTLALEFWDSMAVGARYVFVYRHPWEVADSMQRLGDEIFLRHPDYASQIWTFYNRHVLGFCRRHRERSLLVSSNAAQAKPEQLFALLRSRLGLDSFAVGSKGTEIVDANLFHTHDRNDPLIPLSTAAHGECADVLDELDGVADLSGKDLWTRSPPRPRFLSAPEPASPRVSIVIPCYDHGEYLIEAIASVERSVEEPYELIVINDGSREPRTVEILRMLREIGYQIIDKENESPAAARNVGITLARSNYILPLDADNRLRPGFASAALAVLESMPEVGVVYGDRRDFGLRNVNQSVPQFKIGDLLPFNFIDTCALMRKEVWTDCGGYDANMPSPGWEDWDLWLGAFEHGWQFHHLASEAFDYRVRPDSVIAGVVANQELRRALYQYLVDKHRHLYTEHLSEALLAGHNKLLGIARDAIALRASHDQLHIENGHLAATIESLRLQCDTLAAENKALISEKESTHPMSTPIRPLS